MLKILSLMFTIVFSTMALADGLLRSSASEAIFNQLAVKQKVTEIAVRADCRWPADQTGKPRCELTQGKKSITLTGDAALALRNDAVKAGAGEAPGAGSISFREAQILNCTRKATIGYYTNKGSGKDAQKVWVEPGMEYSCSISAEPSVGPPPELDVVPPTGTTGR